MEPVQSIEPNVKTWNNIRVALYILAAFILFLFALDLMTSSLQHMGKNVAETILQATSNPFTALFIGLLVTAMLQSSSTTTSLVVALVASGSITLQSATPIIMGANVGTTITSTIVSLGFINKKNEFRRAVAAGTYHDFFNILTVVILFPLEYYYGFLSSVSGWISNLFFTPSSETLENRVTHFWVGFSPIINFLIAKVPSPFFLACLSLGLLFASILIFRRLISGLLRAKSPEVFSRFFFKNQFKSFMWGLLTTAAIRSSTITTSVVVPIVAQKIVKLKQAAPFILGANIGTTITAFIAAFLTSNASSALSIAIVHFLFNFIGVMVFFPIPLLRKLPVGLANGMGKLTLKYRLAGLVYLLTTFFFLPFSLIYFNQDSIRTLNLVYDQVDESNSHSQYRIVAKTNARTQSGAWTRYEGGQDIAQDVDAIPSLIFPVSVKNNTLFVGKDMFLFNRPGFCWDGENENGKFQSCIEKILPSMTVSNLTFDSVYVCRVFYPDSPDSVVHQIYLSAPYKIFLQRELISPENEVRVLEKLIRFETY
ncbi:MAG TPA: Na/Pi symporter [Chryseolinea sp.]